MRLSGHFTLDELTKSATALRHGIDNRPGPEEIANLKILAKEILEPARIYYGVPIMPSSGYRSLAVNRLIGSKDSSQHVRGQAVDFEVQNIPNMNLAKWIAQFCKFDQVILEFYHEGQPNSGWVHASVKETDNRGQVMIYDGEFYKDI